MKILDGVVESIRALWARTSHSWTRIVVLALPLLVVLAIVFMTGRSGSDVLAAWIDKEGATHTITRAEMYQSMGDMKERLLQDKAYQKNHLENMLFQRLQAAEAIEAKLHETADYIERTNSHVSNTMLITEFLKSMFPRTSLKFSLPARLTRIILIKRDPYNYLTEPDPNRFTRMAELQKTITNQEKLQQEIEKLSKATITKPIKKTADELVAHESNILAKAKELALEVKKPDADFATLAQVHSGHPSASEGGLIGYLLPRSRVLGPQVIAALAKLKKGEVTGYLNTPEGYLIAKVEDIVEVTDKNLQKYYTDEAKVDFAKNEAWFASVWAFIEKTIADQNGKTIFIYRDRLTSADTNAVVCEFKHPKVKARITRGDLLNKLDSIAPPRRTVFGILDGTLDPARYSADELWNFLEWEMSIPVFRMGAWHEKLPESKAFQEKLQDASRSILARLLSDKRRDSATVSDEEIAAQYDKAKASYVRKLPSGITVQLTLDEVKDKIRDELHSKKINDLFHNWRKELFTRYQARMYEDRFEVVKKTKPAAPKNGAGAQDGAKKNSPK